LLAPDILLFAPVYRPYPDLISNVLRLFADVQVTVVVVVGLVLRIDPADFADETMAPAFYGNLMLVLLVLTVVPVVVSLFYRSPLQRAVGLLQDAALVDADSGSELSTRRQGLRKIPSVVVTMTEPQPWGIKLETKQEKVVVSSVEPGSTADRAGLTVGMVVMSVAGVRVYDAATASRLGASACVPTRLGCDAPASDNIPTCDPDDPQQRETGPDPKPEQLSFSGEDESLGTTGGSVRGMEGPQVLTGPGDTDTTAMLSVARRMEQQGPNTAGAAPEDEDEDEDEDEELLPGDRVDKARP
jgi:hypothetical protein